MPRRDGERISSLATLLPQSACHMITTCWRLQDAVPGWPGIGYSGAAGHCQASTNAMAAPVVARKLFDGESCTYASEHDTGHPTKPHDACVNQIGALAPWRSWVGFGRRGATSGRDAPTHPPFRDHVGSM
jgi:hypothetical protein